MIAKKQTATEIRKRIFQTEKYAVIGAEEMTNEEARKFLFQFDKEIFNVSEKSDYFLIYK